MGKYEPTAAEVRRYEELVERLHENYPSGVVLKLDDGALTIRRHLEQRHLDLMQCGINKKFAAHIGKYDGLFARLCVLWHCVEHSEAPLELFEPDQPPARRPLPAVVTEQTAQRAAAFLHTFLLPHAVAFYGGLLGLSDEHDRLQAVAGYILAHRLEEITNRDVQQGNRTMRGLSRKEMENIFDHLDALGWIDKVPAPRLRDPPHWHVNPECHRLFQDRAKSETERRKKAKQAVADMVALRRQQKEDEA
jgi:Protein of unknown function (DUF3987)